MTVTTTNPSSQQAELYGPPPESSYYGYYRKDWIDLCEDLKGNDRTVYGVLRSLVFEDRRRNVRNDVRTSLSLDDMCALIPGAGGKPITLGGLRDSLRRLTSVGLVSDPEGQPLTTSSSRKAASRPLRIRIHDIPCNDYRPRWTSTEEKLAAIQAGWKSNQTEGVGWISNQPGWKSNQPGWKSNPNPAPKQVKRGPYTSSFTPDLSTSSPAPSKSTTNAGRTEEEAEEESPQKTNTKAVASMAHRIPGSMSQVQRQKLTVAITRLVAAGWGLQALERELTADLGGVRSHYAVYQKRLGEFADLTPVADTDHTAAADAAPQRRADDCDQCDPNGLVEVDDGTPDGRLVRCPHDGSIVTAAAPESTSDPERLAQARAALTAFAESMNAT